MDISRAVESNYGIEFLFPLLIQLRNFDVSIETFDGNRFDR